MHGECGRGRYRRPCGGGALATGRGCVAGWRTSTRVVCSCVVGWRTVVAWLVWLAGSGWECFVAESVGGGEWLVESGWEWSVRVGPGCLAESEWLVELAVRGAVGPAGGGAAVGCDRGAAAHEF